MLTLKRDLKYLGIVDFMGHGTNWFDKAKRDYSDGMKSWKVRVHIPWDDKKKYDYMFEINERAGECRYYTLDDAGKIGERVDGEPFERCTRENLFLYMNEVIKDKWQMDGAREYRGL